MNATAGRSRTAAKQRVAAAVLIATLLAPAASAGDPSPASLDEALAAWYRGDLPRAVAAWRAAVEREPEDAAARRSLARLLREAGHHEEVLLHYEQLLGRESPDEQTRLAAAETALLARQPRRALSYLEPAAPGAAALTLSAFALVDEGATREAARLLEQSLQTESFQPLAWLRRASLQEELGDLAQAEASYLRALAQEPNLTEAYQPLARIALSSGRTERAHALLRRAAAALPSDSGVADLLAELEDRYPEMVAAGGEIRRGRIEAATARRAEGFPAERAALPPVRIGLIEDAQTVRLKTGGAFALAAGGAAVETSGAPATILVARHGGGGVEITDARGAVIVPSAPRVSLRYDDPADTTILFDVEYGQGSFWAGSEDRVYRGSIELAARPRGLTVVNVLSVEEYLYSVLPSEMPAWWPQEALRAQAVAARSYTMANLGRFASRGFDLLGTVASAAYRGVLAETPAARAAVDATRGLVLMDGEKPLAAYYSANHGGHSDTTRDVWGFASPIPARPDPRLAGLRFPLPPDELARWLSERPATYSSHPGYSSRSAYRWKLVVRRTVIEARIGRGSALGAIVALEPAGRSASGRVSSVRVRGTSGEHVVRGDALRWTLGGLRSNLFVVEPRLGADGLPEAFVFTGAGWGHGVGLCQSGAAGMAAAGFSAAAILAHYYGEAPLKPLY